MENVTEKRLRVDISYIREAVSSYSLQIQHVKSSDQLAHVFTKYRRQAIQTTHHRILKI